MNPEKMLAACGVVRAEAIGAFARLADRGFRVAEHTGFYPRVRAEREQPWSLGIDFWMALDERGQYRTEWSREAPFDLGGSASITRYEGEELVRYWMPYTLYGARPYDAALRTLEADVLAVAEIIEGWSEDVILGTGKRVPIRQTPRT
jgi:hypothetical protein